MARSVKMYDAVKARCTTHMLKNFKHGEEFVGFRTSLFGGLEVLRESGYETIKKGMYEVIELLDEDCEQKK